MSTSRDWRPGFEQQTARINTTDDTWRAFRQLCLDNDEHVSAVLGRLVDVEVRRRRPAPRPVADKPAPRRVDASTREHAAKVKAASSTATTRPTSSTATTSTPTLFDP